MAFDMSHLSEEEQEEENRRLEEDIAYDVASEVDIHVPEDRNNPTPGAHAPGPHKQKKKEDQVAIRQPRRDPEQTSPSVTGISCDYSDPAWLSISA